MKYYNTLIGLQEVPDEVSLVINLTNCPIHCPGCHAKMLWDDIGHPLNWGSLNALVHINSGITCVAFMGGDMNPKQISVLAEKVKRMGLKTCWYSGKQELHPDIDLANFDYIKLGPYIEKDGPLDCRTTNQRFYKVRDGELLDITDKFWR